MDTKRKIQVIIVNFSQKYITLCLDSNVKIKDLKKIYEKKINYDLENIVFYHDDKKIDLESDLTIEEYFKDKSQKDSYWLNSTIFIRELPLMKGGGPLIELINAIFHIGGVFELMWKALVYIAQFIIWFIQFVVWFILEVANPAMFIRDVIGSIKVVTLTLVMAPFQFIYYMVKKMVNGILESVIGAFWGWDKVPRDGWDYHESKYFNRAESKCRGKKCYVTKSGTIPFSILLGTIICPPIGVFMEYGFTGWINILVCILLTFCFYFPGLIYALIIIYT